MGTSWAVGAAATLALFAVATLTSLPMPLGYAITPPLLVVLALGALAVGTWAYAISMGAHGSRGALVTLLLDAALALAAGAWGAVHGVAASGIALALVALLSIWAIGSELRARRGPLHLATALVFAAASAAFVIAWALGLGAGAR